MLKLLIFSFGGLVGIVLAIMAVGLLIPKQHVASRALVLRQKPEDVFALISDFKSAPAWRSEVRQVELLPQANGHVRFREIASTGALTMEVTQWNPPRHMVTRIADKELPFGGSWIFEISPTVSGCQLNITERGEIYNPVFRFVSRFILGYERTLNTYLQSVGRKFGENTAPVPGKAAAL